MKTKTLPILFGVSILFLVLFSASLMLMPIPFLEEQGEINQTLQLVVGILFWVSLAGAVVSIILLRRKNKKLNRAEDIRKETRKDTWKEKTGICNGLPVTVVDLLFVAGLIVFAILISADIDNHYIAFVILGITGFMPGAHFLFDSSLLKAVSFGGKNKSDKEDEKDGKEMD